MFLNKISRDEKKSIHRRTSAEKHFRPSDILMRMLLPAILEFCNFQNFQKRAAKKAL